MTRYISRISPKGKFSVAINILKRKKKSLNSQLSYEFNNPSYVKVKWILSSEGYNTNPMAKRALSSRSYSDHPKGQRKDFERPMMTRVYFFKDRFARPPTTLISDQRRSYGPAARGEIENDGENRRARSENTKQKRAHKNNRFFEKK